MIRRSAAIPLAILLFAAPCLADPPVDYGSEVRPILVRNCYSCHGAKAKRAGLRVDTVALMIQGGKVGPVVVPGKSGASLLIHAMRGENDATPMPYKKPRLSDEQIRVVAAWIDQGAKAPAVDKTEDAALADHWSFQPPQRPALPSVSDSSWIRNPIDRFILARLDRLKISPAPEADRATMIRRLSLDLTGLPPALKDVDDFVNDARADAYEQLVDRLLSSPHYGERWGRHWLDVARYADSNGFSVDSPREIWKYRDWVIDALNRDLPFDRFVVEQMAGDLLPKATLDQKIATGFHRNTLINEEGGVDKEQFRVEAVADRVATVGAAFLGLTLNCARCHDHKYDPISQKEHFQLFAFLNNQSESTLTLASADVAARREAIRVEVEALEKALNKKLRQYLDGLPEAEQAKLDGEIATILLLGPEQRSDAQKQKLATAFAKKSKELKSDFDRLGMLKKQQPKAPTTLVLKELAKPRDTYIHLGGDFTRPGDKVEPGVLAVLPPLPDLGQSLPNRLDLANWLVARNNPLTARVAVNRLWQRYFGLGIVETENDFGTQGAPPSHPDLLDLLAVDFMESGWSLKHMHRLIVTSATYRQSSRARPELAEVDPINRLLARQNRLRLDAEVVRDNALAASGLLNRTVGGPSVFPPQPQGVYQFTQVSRSWNTSVGPDRFRRGLYIFFQRSAPYPALTVFDAPDANSACTRRVRSNTPLQALTLLNDAAYLELARGLAERVLREGPAGDAARLQFAFRLCLAREARTAERTRLIEFLAKQREEFRAAPADAVALLTAAGANLAPGEDAAEPAAWTAVARVLLNLDEFITRE
jgi:mono/diheme cytochrome c family protein